MKPLFSFLPGFFYALLFSAFIVLFGCHPPVLPDGCNKWVVNDQLSEPVLRKITVDGLEKNPANLKIKSSEKYLAIELEPTVVDSYRFKLNNRSLNSCWITTPYPQIHFTFLQGGTYTLDYATIKNHTSSQHKTLYFQVEEALVEKAWFYPSLATSILLILGAIVYFWTLYNIRQKLKMQHVRSRIAADLHDEVSSDLSSISISMVTLERRTKDASTEFTGVVREIQQTLSETQNNLADTVWAIKPDKDSSGELFQRMHKFARQMFINGDTKLVFLNTIPTSKSLNINMEQRHNIFKIFKEVIHNIYKHAQATEVEIKIFPHPEGFGMIITDNGIGFDPAAEREGNGISNYQWRAKESFIDFHLESAPGKGTRIKMIVPQF